MTAALLVSAIASMPLALDGESAAGNSTGIAIISLVSIVFGYVLLFCLWHFVFRERARTRRKNDSSER
ncbi:MAG TPA: hypothetical protein VGD00_00845 [Solirubrobacteraceae bacterium]|jgi:uncharacterized membrane protein HdeD (DUF308 family)